MFDLLNIRCTFSSMLHIIEVANLDGNAYAAKTKLQRKNVGNPLRLAKLTFLRVQSLKVLVTSENEILGLVPTFFSALNFRMAPANDHLSPCQANSSV